MNDRHEDMPGTPPAAGEARPQAPAPDAAPPIPPVATALPSVPAPPAGRRHAWRTLVFGLAIFVCGGVVGAGGALLGLRGMAVRVMRQPPDLSAERAGNRLQRSLGLTDSQARQVREIYARHFTALHNDWRETRLRMGTEVREMREEIAKVLTEKQAAQWRRRVEIFERALPTPDAVGPNGPRPVGPTGSAPRSD